MKWRIIPIYYERLYLLNDSKVSYLPNTTNKHLKKCSIYSKREVVLLLFHINHIVAKVWNFAVNKSKWKYIILFENILQLVAFPK